MASFVYAVWSITNVASVHCAVRPEISPCTCEPTYAHNYVELSCEKVDSFHQIVDALSNKFEPFVNISLKISHSQLEDLEMRSFTDMNLNLVKLRMQWNGLRSVPELPFRGLSNVEYLGIGDNELEEIPKHMLNHMPIVKTLDMGRCRIRSVLQDDFKGTQMLMNLFMPSNNITRLDRTTFPPGLITLHLGRNQIENLNGTLRHLNKLESLFINMNNISCLDDELPESNRLKLIIAQNNRLERLPESMRHMDKLETLHLQYNRLKSLDGILKNARNLNELYAFNNKIEFLARDEFQSSVKLEDLFLAYNNIKSLNSSLLPLRRLYKANFSFNAISEFSMNEIRGLMNLKQLDLSNNLIEKLTGRQENNIDKNSYLIEFYLDHNRLKSLDGALMGLNSLRILGLTHNQIERILPEDFIGLEKLEILELSHNKLLTLKEMQMTVLPSLKILKVDYNNLTRLEKDFHGLPVLCQANLTNNQITSISHELVSKTRCMNHNVPGKLELYLEENPINCNIVLNEFCPILLAQETRIRVRTKCFDTYEDVCKNLPVVIVLQQEHTKQVIPVIVPSSELLLTKKTDTLLPPLLAPLGQPIIKPLIIAPQLAAVDPSLVSPAPTTTPTPTTITSTPTPTPTTSATTTATSSSTSTSTTITISTTNASPSPQGTVVDGIDYKRQVNESFVTANTLNDAEMDNFDLAMINSTTSTATATETARATATAAATATATVTATTAATMLAKQEVATPEAQSILVFDIDDAPIVPSPVMLETAPKTEYATLEYIPTLEKSNPNGSLSPPPPDVLMEDDSNSNFVQEDYPAKVLLNFDNAPQSLIVPEEPPENP